MDLSPQAEPQINKLFRMARKLQASDLYLEPGSAPQLRLRGSTKMMEMRPLSEQDIECLLSPILYAAQQERLKDGAGISFTYACDEGDPYNVSVSRTGGQLKLSAHRLEAASS